MSPAVQNNDTPCRIGHPAIKQVWLDQLGATRFLANCHRGNVSRDQLQLFVKQQQLYSRHFTRYLAALLSNLEDDNDCLELAKNLFDEMGFGDAGSLPHSVLYQDMMTRMGIASDNMPLPATQRLIDTLFQCCRTPNYLIGLGALCLGTEAIVPFVYSSIVNGFLSIGEPLENLEFFTLHIHCDDDHSETMLKMIDKELARNPKAEVDLTEGAEKIIQARIDFFNSF